MRFKPRFTTAEKPQETANMPRRSWRNRIDDSQDVNLPRASKREPKPSADKKIFVEPKRTATWTAYAWKGISVFAKSQKMWKL